MTKFESDMQKAQGGNEIQVITDRRAEIKKLEEELVKCKNSFRSQALFQEITKLKRELEQIENSFSGENRTIKIGGYYYARIGRGTLGDKNRKVLERVKVIGKDGEGFIVETVNEHRSIITKTVCKSDFK